MQTIINLKNVKLVIITAILHYKKLKTKSNIK